jgi:hypothetical protein
MVAIIVAAVLLTGVKLGIVTPAPDAGKPMLVLLFAHEKVLDPAPKHPPDAPNVIAGKGAPGQTGLEGAFEGIEICIGGHTVMVYVIGFPVQPA